MHEAESGTHLQREADEQEKSPRDDVDEAGNDGGEEQHRAPFNRHKIPKVGRAQPFDCWGHWCEQIVAAVVGEEAQEHDEQGESGGACGGFLAFVGEFDCVWGMMCRYLLHNKNCNAPTTAN